MTYRYISGPSGVERELDVGRKPIPRKLEGAFHRSPAANAQERISGCDRLAKSAFPTWIGETRRPRALAALIRRAELEGAA
jgi:hypothetical protein